MHDIGLRTAPTLWHQVFAVIDIALFLVGACLVGVVTEVGCVGIPVTHIAIGACVGLAIGIDETVIADGIRILDDLVECGLQFCALLAVGTAIVGASVVGALSPHTGPSQSHDHCYYLFSHDSLVK